MPVVLQPENEQLWLHHPFNSPEDAVFLQSLLKPAAELEAYRVSTLVNNPANEGPECIQPI
jgi:putative SOS response-associated peptidase YedK